MENIIEVKNISKKYTLGQQKSGYLTLRDVLMNAIKSPLKSIKRKKEKDEFWALKDISFTVKKGEAVGIIGANGAGKSTLLKILSQITPPTEGEIKMRGRVASLLEVGTGFHSELTGRENIFLNGSILGMKKKEIKDKFDEIVKFSGVEKFLDTPVKRYSSGMKVRLAFSVAAHLEPEILIVDEVLAVGDAEFQKKCLGKMDEVVRKSDRTIIFVSHNMNAIRNLCKKCIFIDEGRIKAAGESRIIIDTYLNKWKKTEAVRIFEENEKTEAKLKKISILNSKNKATTEIAVSEDFYVEIEYKFYKPVKKALLQIQFFSVDGEILLLSTETDKDPKLIDYKVGNYKTIVRIPKFLFNLGKLSFDISLQQPFIKDIDKIKNIRFEIMDRNNPKLYAEWKGLGKIATKLDYKTLIK